MASTDEKQMRIQSALTESLQRSQADRERDGIVKVDISSAKLIILSDLHKGARNGADDFQVSERAYNAALAFYFHQGYSLVSLGDVEELWEERPGPVFKAYQRSLFLESEFHRTGRLMRFWGNHDDNWRYQSEVDKLLGRLWGGNPLQVRESQLLQVVKGDEVLGDILLLHGHQGTLDSDRFKGISRFLVRQFWRPFQRLTKISLNTPARDWRLRQGHNAALYEWSKGQKGLVLIAGHTHRPVFRSRTHEIKVRDLLQEAESRLAQEPDDVDLLQEFSELAAELEWIRAQGRQAPNDSDPIEFKKPSYFNTGCCCFTDGDITGLELSDGHFSLVRWPNADSRPRPHILESASIESVFAEL